MEIAVAGLEKLANKFVKSLIYGNREKIQRQKDKGIINLEFEIDGKKIKGSYIGPCKIVSIG